MINQKYPRKTRCIISLVAAALCLCVMLCIMYSLHSRLDDALTRVSEAEERVDTHKLDLVKAMEANESLQGFVVELQESNDKLRKALDAYNYDFNIAAPTPPHYLDIPVDQELQSFIWSMCCDYDIEEHYLLIYAIMKHESNFKSDVVSATNDYGLMQINVSNHANLSKLLGITDFLDPYQNVQAGIYMFANALHKYGNVSDALMAYNMGGGGASKLWAQGIHSTGYSRSVLDIFYQFSENI